MASKDLSTRAILFLVISAKPYHLFASSRAKQNGAGGGSRTHTGVTPLDFESSASASFTTPAESILSEAKWWS